MSKWPMRGHFRYLLFKTFPMTPRTLQCEVFWAFLSNFKHSGVPEDSKSPTLGVLGFTPTLGQSGVATESRWTLEILESNFNGQNSIAYGVLYIIGKILKRIYIYIKWARIVHLDIWNTSYGQKKGRKFDY